MSINILNGSNYDQSNRVISSIVGNVMTTTTTWNISVSGASAVYSSFVLIEAQGNNKIYDLNIDGNKSNYSFYRWETAKEIYVEGDRNILSGNYLYESPGESLYITGDDNTIKNNTITNTNGNGIHLSAVNHTTVDGNKIINGNLECATMGHCTGLIAWSMLVSNTTIVNNYLENGYAGVGGPSGNNGDDTTISNNTIVNCTNYAINVYASDNDVSNNFTITGNRIYDSVSVYLSQNSGTATSFPSRFLVANNYLKNTQISVQRLKNVSIVDNVMEDTGDVSTTQIEIKNTASYVTVKGNHVNGGVWGIGVSNAGGNNILIEGNVLTGQYSTGIRLDQPSLINVAAINNSVSNDNTAASDYIGIYVNTEEIGKGNSVNVVKGHSGIYAKNSSLIEGNMVRSSGATYSIRADGGTSNIIFRNNQTDVAISNGGGSSNKSMGNGLIGGLPSVESGLSWDGTNLGLGIGGSFQIRTGTDDNHSIVFKPGESNAISYYEYGGTLANGLGHKFYTGGSQGSQTLKFQVANNGSYFSGSVGIGTTSPWRTLSVTGTMAVTALTAGAAGDYAVCINNTTKELTNAGATGCVVSSKRFKENISELDSGLDELMQLKPSKFTYIGQTGEHIGLIAEDVNEIDKRLVEYEADGITPRTVRYLELSALLIKSIQELNLKVDDLSHPTTPSTAQQATSHVASDGLFSWIVEKFTTAFGINFGQDKVVAKNLCAKKSDGSEVCVDGDQLQILLDKNVITQTSSSTSSSSSSSTAETGSVSSSSSSSASSESSSSSSSNSEASSFSSEISSGSSSAESSPDSSSLESSSFSEIISSSSSSAEALSSSSSSL